MTVQERVARGAHWLDQASPGWRDAMALRTFDLASTCRCVLGQVFAAAAAPTPGYDYALITIVTREERLACADWPQAHGFAPQSGTSDLVELEAEWCRVIHGRRDELTTGVRVLS